MESKKIKTIDQKIIKVPEINRPDYDYGYRDRPINSKRQTYNNYLDSCLIKKTSTTGLTNEFSILSTDLTTLGNLKWIPFTYSGSGAIYFPAPGTYIITSRINEGIGDTSTKSILKIANQDNTIVGLVASVPNSLNVVQYGSISFIINAAKGDYIWFSGETDNSGGIIYMETSITKIS